MIVLLLNNHSAALISSVAWNTRPRDRALRPGGRLAKQSYSLQTVLCSHARYESSPFASVQSMLPITSIVVRRPEAYQGYRGPTSGWYEEFSVWNHCAGLGCSQPAPVP